MYEIETRSHEPVNLFAGEFPTVTEEGVAGAAIAERTPVTKDSNGKIVAVAAGGGEGKPPAFSRQQEKRERLRLQRET
jgi:hypothetical protein